MKLNNNLDYILLQKELFGDAYLTISQTAKILNCSRMTIYRYIKSDKLKTKNIRTTTGKIKKLISYNSIINLYEEVNYESRI